MNSSGQVISWLLSHPPSQSPLEPLGETEDHGLALHRGLVPTGRLKHTAPRLGFESKRGAGIKRKPGSPAVLSLGGFPCHLPLLGVVATRVLISAL